MAELVQFNHSPLSVLNTPSGATALLQLTVQDNTVVCFGTIISASGTRQEQFGPVPVIQIFEPVQGTPAAKLTTAPAPEPAPAPSIHLPAPEPSQQPQEDATPSVTHGELHAAIKDFHAVLNDLKAPQVPSDAGLDKGPDLSSPDTAPDAQNTSRTG